MHKNEFEYQHKNYVIQSAHYPRLIPSLTLIHSQHKKKETSNFIHVLSKKNNIMYIINNRKRARNVDRENGGKSSLIIIKEDLCKYHIIRNMYIVFVRN